MRQQKVRTALTLIGVVVGTFALVLSLAVGRGVDRAIVNLFHEDDRLRKIIVNPNYENEREDMPAESPRAEGLDERRQAGADPQGAGADLERSACSSASS